MCIHMYNVYIFAYRNQFYFLGQLEKTLLMAEKMLQKMKLLMRQKKLMRMIS